MSTVNAEQYIGGVKVTPEYVRRLHTENTRLRHKCDALTLRNHELRA